MLVTGNITPDSKVGKELGLIEEVGFSAEYNFGENPAEAAAIFGEEVVFNYFLKEAVVAFQAKLRSIAARIQAGKLTNEQGAAEAAAWKLGTIQRVTGGNLVEKAKKSVEKLSAAQKQELLAQLKASMAE